MIEYITAGESHGPMLVGIIKNIPAGLTVDKAFIDGELSRRMLGFGRGGRMKIERDTAEFVTGVRGGKTLGSPLTAIINNRDHENWKDIMGFAATKEGMATKRVTAVRPGHADLSGAVKYGFDDARNVLERASARETAMRVCLGAVCKLYLKELGIEIYSHTVSLGGIDAAKNSDYVNINARADLDPVRCLDGKASAKMQDVIRAAAENGDTVGGVTEIVIIGCKSGIGSYVSSDRKLDGLIMREIGATQSVKAVEIGDGIRNASVLGSSVHDELFTDNGKLYRKSNRAGGLEGGMSNGEPIIIRAYCKPIPTLKQGLNTVDIESGKAVKATPERSDVCAVPAAGVVCEAAAALALTAALSDMLGGDTMDEVKARYELKRSFNG
ncbi:MAG: chorismate synthase [Clostridiales bacterium]|nr:chorismate synthase [Clostridiales bacterium]